MNQLPTKEQLVGIAVAVAAMLLGGLFYWSGTMMVHPILVQFQEGVETVGQVFGAAGLLLLVVVGWKTIVHCKTPVQW
ncbi:hypothetical protein ACX64O_28710 (plasmid) [Pseudomonas fitomaticsae]